jgi:predicted RNase H-like HicB family nuclease
MLTDYIDAALRKAKYKVLDDGTGIFGEIPGFPGLWASAASLERCRDELKSTLESWIVVKLRHNDTDLPKVGGINLNQRMSRRARVA